VQLSPFPATPAQVERLLAGTCLLSKARTILNASAATWSDLTPYLTTPGPLGPLPPQLYSREAIMWGISMCLTRSVRLDSRGGLTVLVPWADLLNHEPAADCYLDWEEGAQAVVLRPDRDYKPGEQVRAGRAQGEARGLSCSLRYQGERRCELKG
jgi:hypothetical protein